MARSLARMFKHPGLWMTAMRMGWRLKLFPDPVYMRFRMVTMYGDAGAQPRSHDLVTYLKWCKAWGRITR